MSHSNRTGEDGLTPGSKDWADVILAMRQAAVDRFNARRNLEWRFSFTLWGGLAISANVLRFVNPSAVVYGILFFGGVLIVALHWGLAYAFYTGGKRDRDDGRRGRVGRRQARRRFRW